MNFFEKAGRFYVREFEGVPSREKYFELDQMISQVLDIHFLEERNAWCKLDDHGDIEDIVKVIEIEATTRGFEYNSGIKSLHLMNLLVSVIIPYAECLIFQDTIQMAFQDGITSLNASTSLTEEIFSVG